MVLPLAKLSCPRGNVHVLSAGGRGGKRSTSSCQVSLVGQVPHIVLDVLICDQHAPGGLLHEVLPLPQAALAGAILLYDHATGAVSSILHLKAWREREKG